MNDIHFQLYSPPYSSFTAFFPFSEYVLLWKSVKRARRDALKRPVKARDSMPEQPPVLLVRCMAKVVIMQAKPKQNCREGESKGRGGGQKTVRHLNGAQAR